MKLRTMNIIIIVASVVLCSAVIASMLLISHRKVLIDGYATNIADSLNLENYGWGGMYENRDCSAFIRDILMNVGIFLPRNSLAQVNAGKSSPYSTYVALPKDNDEKIALIRKFALPFRTILWLKGHIMLYIGEYNNQPIVMHDVWGVQSSEGLNILGGISITTLTPGNEQNGINPPSSLLDRIEAMNIIVK